MSDTTLLGQFVAFLNANIFLREFSFAKTEFTPPGSSEIELADHVVRIGQLLFLYQLKERDPSGTTPIEVWLEKKVLKRATKQIRDTVQLLSAGHPVVIANERGHRFDLAARSDDRCYRVVLFKSGQKLTPLPYPRFHVSQTVGFIHVFDAHDYFGICRYLLTPVEIADYLTWREKALQSSAGAVMVSEAAQVGQFMVDAVDKPPDERYRQVLGAAHNDLASFDLSYLFNNLGDHVEYASSGDRETSYYPILQMFAQLNRAELRAFKERFLESLRAVKEDRFILPLRFVSPKLDCGFLLLPLCATDFDNRSTALQNFSLAAKYDHKTTHEIGVSIVSRDGDLLIDWLYVSWPWVHDPELEEHLRKNYPFRPVHEARLPRYYFRTEQLKQSEFMGDQPQEDQPPNTGAVPPGGPQE